jgi:transposase
MREQLKTKAREHQICLQHLKRDCKKLIEVYQSKWAMKLSNLIDKIIDLSKLKKITLIEKHKTEQSLSKLLESPLSKSPPKVKTLKDSLSKLQRALTTCLYERYVQPTNNSSEQAIRKIKEKISGCFRSEKGLTSYALITSVIDSAIKQNIHPFEAILNPNLVVAK